MIARSVVMVAITSSLVGCASEPPWKRGPIASAGPERLLHQSLQRRITGVARPAPDSTIAENALLNSLEPRSAEWRIAYAKIEAARDKRLAAKLVICRGCFDASSESRE